MTIVKHKRGTGIPSPSSLEVGEIAIDTSTGTAYTKAGDGRVVPVGGDSSGGDGAGMVIQPDEPADPVTGMQWMDSTTGRIWIWDDDKWLEFPAGCGSGGGGGGGAWEFIDKLSGSDISAFEFDINRDEFHTYRFFVDITPSKGPADCFVRLGSEGAWITSSEYTSECSSQRRGLFTSSNAKANYWTFTKDNQYQNASHWEITLSGLRPYQIYNNRPAISWLGGGGQSSNDTMLWVGSGTLNYNNAPIDKIMIYPKPPILWDGELTIEGIRK